MSVVIFFLVFSLVSLIASIVQIGKYYESFYNLFFSFFIVCGVEQLNKKKRRRNWRLQD